MRSAPRELLKAIGAELVEMAHPDYCCGSAGTYNVTQNELSMKILEQKMDEVARHAGGDHRHRQYRMHAAIARRESKRAG